MDFITEMEDCFLVGDSNTALKEILQHKTKELWKTDYYSTHISGTNSTLHFYVTIMIDHSRSFHICTFVSHTPHSFESFYSFLLIETFPLCYSMEA